jgi:hypothetical protein
VKFNKSNFPSPLIALEMNNLTVNKVPDITAPMRHFETAPAEFDIFKICVGIMRIYDPYV